MVIKEKSGQLLCDSPAAAAKRYSKSPTVLKCFTTKKARLWIQKKIPGLYEICSLVTVLRSWRDCKRNFASIYLKVICLPKHMITLWASTIFFFLQYWGLNSEPTPPPALFLWCFISRYGLENYLPGLASNHSPPDRCLLRSWDCRPEHLAQRCFL
jgi:hypothetical protein